jgi:hypothetical protein
MRNNIRGMTPSPLERATCAMCPKEGRFRFYWMDWDGAKRQDAYGCADHAPYLAHRQDLQIRIAQVRARSRMLFSRPYYPILASLP